MKAAALFFAVLLILSAAVRADAVSGGQQAKSAGRLWGAWQHACACGH